MEHNNIPGPELVIHKSNVSVRTYNCNGLGVTDKFRRILVKIRKETESGGIVLLQETHIKKKKIIIIIIIICSMLISSVNKSWTSKNLVSC